MSFFHLDPHRPHIDGAAIFCPGCGQSYDTILGGWLRLPPRHYPRPTLIHGGVNEGETIVGTEVCLGNQHGLCPVDCDHLVAHLFRAQIAAAQEKAA